MNINYGVFSDVGWRWRMEDAHRIMEKPELHFFGAEVFDGHLGPGAAQTASSLLMDNFLHFYLREKEKPSSQRLAVAHLIKDAYLATDEEIVRQGIISGTAAVSFYIIGDKFWAANVGDSRAIIETETNSKALTPDHRPSLPSEKARIEALGGKVVQLDVPRVEGDLALSRTLGDIYLKPLVTPQPVISEGLLAQENQRAIIACDGIWDVLPQEEVLMLARKKESPQKASEHIVEKALEAGSFDNMTVIVLDLSDFVKKLPPKKMEIFSEKDWAQEQ